MAKAALLLSVRFTSRLSFEEIMRIVEERAPEFEALQGLRQKYYIHDKTTGQVGGVYIWDSEEAFDAYRESELRASIAQAYQVEGEPRIELYEIVKELRQK